MSLLNIQKYSLVPGTWVPVYLTGNIARAWLVFDGDIIIGDSTSDVTQQETLLLSQGNQFMIPLPISMSTTTPILLCYITASTAPVNCILTFVNTKGN